ncbi:DUF4870 family protein [Candidatus Thiodiazotropha sp. LNASS1]|uniref:DUF4870 family protein n=1 Tax=Candidatus Thiodiazotropha sp. LNASS1 TaxID=3096260 RepID=UPI0034DEFB67
MNGSTKAINNIHNDREKTIAMAVYALQALSFLFVITFLIAVIINYVKRDDVRNSWLESHYRWQIRTFWFSLLWIVIGYLTIFILIGYPVLLVNMVWLIYRIIKGWLRLSEGREMYGMSNHRT